MIISFLRRLFAGMPPRVMNVIYALGGACIAVIANALQAFSVGVVWDTHVILQSLAAAVATVLLRQVLGADAEPQ